MCITNITCNAIASHDNTDNTIVISVTLVLVCMTENRELLTGRKSLRISALDDARMAVLKVKLNTDKDGVVFRHLLRQAVPE